MDHDVAMAAPCPLKELKKAVFTKNYPLVRAILEKEKDSKKIQKKGLQIRIPLEYTGIFYGDGARREIKIPLYNEKAILITLLKTYRGKLTSDNYRKAKNRQDLREGYWSVDCTGISYPPNLLGHACFFGNTTLLQELLSYGKKTLPIYNTNPASALELAAEYDNPECFKILYTTPWLHTYFVSNPQLLETRCNYLEAFIFYRQDLKIVETLLKTGCFDSNDSIRVYRDCPEHFKGKTLLEIVLAEKDKDSKHKLYYEKVADLLRAYGGKTAAEIASIYSFSNLPHDQLQQILYSLDHLGQQRLRPICNRWKSIVENSTVNMQLQSYLGILRNSAFQNGNKVFGAKVRILSAAVYQKEYSLVKMMLPCLKKERIKNYLNCFQHLTPYNPHYFFDDNRDDEMKTIFQKHGYIRGYFDSSRGTRNPLLDELVIASFLQDTQKIAEIAHILRDQLNNYHPLLYVVLDDVLCTMAHTDDAPGMKILVNILKDQPFFKEQLGKLLRLCNYHNSPEVSKILSTLNTTVENK
jgi:hypothetical protein